MREKTIYEKIAEKYNTTPEEVRREMQIAIDAGFDNPNPAVQEEWKKMTLKGERPTPEEVINYADEFALSHLKETMEKYREVCRNKNSNRTIKRRILAIGRKFG